MASSHSQSHSAIAKTVGPRPVVLTPGARVFVSRSSGFPSENSSNRMLEQWEEHQPPIRSNMCFGVAVSARSGVQLARLVERSEARKTPSDGCSLGSNPVAPIMLQWHRIHPPCVRDEQSKGLNLFLVFLVAYRRICADLRLCCSCCCCSISEKRNQSRRLDSRGKHPVTDS